MRGISRVAEEYYLLKKGSGTCGYLQTETTELICLHSLALKDRTDTLFRNVSNGSALDAA
jgi:hypothetical protein